MREYIDKQGFLSALEKQINYFVVRNRTTEENVVKQIFAFVEAIPADDVRENVRGEWIGKPKQENVFCRICSNCNQYSPVSFHCINCGADMCSKK